MKILIKIGCAKYREILCGLTANPSAGRAKGTQGYSRHVALRAFGLVA
jgi:hypothetical protein